MYTIRLADGEGTEIAASRVAESRFKMFNTDGNNKIFFRDILDHKSDDITVSQNYGLIHHPDRIPNYRNTTKGRKMKIEWYACTMKTE